jgi:hypothetical protein
VRTTDLEGDGPGAAPAVVVGRPTGEAPVPTGTAAVWEAVAA